MSVVGKRWGFYYSKAQSDRMQPPVRRWYHFSYLSPIPRLKYWMKCSVVDSHSSFTSFFVQVQTVFTASLKRGAYRKSKPVLCFLQSIKQYLQQTSSSLPAGKPGNELAPGLTIQSFSIPPTRKFLCISSVWLVHGRAAPTDCFFRLIFGSCQLAAS